jgi:hypothetical protein
LVPRGASADQLSKVTGLPPGGTNDALRRRAPDTRDSLSAGAAPAPARTLSGGDHQRRQRCQCQRCQRCQRHQTCWVGWVAAAASPITTPLAGIAEATETPQSPTAAAVTAARAIILSVISSSSTKEVEFETSYWSRNAWVQLDVPCLHFSMGCVNAALAHDRSTDISRKIMRKFETVPIAICFNFARRRGSPPQAPCAVAARSRSMNATSFFVRSVSSASFPVSNGSLNA